jgi:hypothetical protein
MTPEERNLLKLVAETMAVQMGQVINRMVTAGARNHPLELEHRKLVRAIHDLEQSEAARPNVIDMFPGNEVGGPVDAA